MSLKRTVFHAKAATILRSSRDQSRTLLTNETLDREALAQLSAQRAIDHARFAMEHSPFYRDRYSAAGFTLEDLRDPSVFAELPIVEKADVREHGERFRTDEATAENARRAGTGGSTSAPLQLWHDRRFPVRVLEWRLYRWWGVHPSDNVATVYRQFWSKEDARRHHLKWWPSRRIQLDTARMDEEHVDRFIAEWKATSPAVLTGYVGGIVELSRILAARGTRLKPPKAIGVTAAPMTVEQRTEVEEVFGAPVHDHYRCGEIPWLAGECAAHEGMHTFADLRKVEVLDDDDRPAPYGVTGQTVITDMTNRVFPLVRYRLGDRAATLDGVCSCGVTLPRISSVAGRITDAARLPDGQVIAGDFLTEIFVPHPQAVRQFQVHQHQDYSITLRCIPGASASWRTEVDAVATQLREIVRDTVPIRLEIVEEIPHDGGKIRYIKSDLV